MVSNTTTSLHFLLEMLTIPVFVRLYTAESSPWLQSQVLYYICLKYICIDLSEHRRLGCPCLRLTDDDDDSRPAQMIPIALMIPAGTHHPLWSTFSNISISISIFSPAPSAAASQKQPQPHARAYQLWLSRLRSDLFPSHCPYEV